MIKKSKIILFTLTMVLMWAKAKADTGKYFDKAIFVIFENTDYAEVMKQPFFSSLASKGAQFNNFKAITHPSQPNYIALTSGQTYGVKDDSNVNLDVKNIADLIEAKGLTWKVYAEDFPKNCFTGATSGAYVRKHVPFLSYLNIQKNPKRCSQIVNAKNFLSDVKNNKLPNYVFYVPNNKNNGHDTGVSFADKWYSKTFGPILNNSDFLKDTVLITTFDEGTWFSKNIIYTNIIGNDVKPGTFNQNLNTYSLLKLMEENWSLGDLGQLDKTANSFPTSMWK